MAFKRRTYKKRSYRKKRFFKKRTGIKRSRKGMNVHYIKRTSIKSVTLTNSTPFLAINSDSVGNAYNQFTLGQIPNFAEFQSLFDEYKICGIKLKFVFDKTDATMSTPNSMPELWTLYDNNDQAQIANETEALQYSSLKVKRMLYPISRYFRPYQNLVSGGPNATTTQVKSKWNATTQADIVHTGIKMAVRQVLASTGTTVQGNINIYTTWYVGFRNPK